MESHDAEYAAPVAFPVRTTLTPHQETLLRHATQAAAFARTHMTDVENTLAEFNATLGR